MEDYLKKTQDFFNALGPTSMSHVQEFYHPEIEFLDPLGGIDGVDALERYYTHMYRNVQAIRFEFHNCLRDDVELFLPWTMHLQAKGLNGGKAVSLDGASHIRFDSTSQQAIYHRDYFDLDAFIYQHIPVLRSALGLIKKRLAGHSSSSP